MSDYSFLWPLWSALATHHRYSKYVDSASITEVKRAYEEKGIALFTTILPLLGKWVESLSSMAPGDNPGIPYLMGLLPGCVSGDPAAIDSLRQLTLAFYKLEVPYSQEIKSEFLSRFVETDLAIPDFDQLLNNEDLIIRARKLIARVLCNANPFDIVPGHGPGVTSCRTKTWDKWHKFKYFPELDALFPYSDYFFFSATHLADENQRLERSKVGVPRARVILVPKDSRGPRVISAEPLEYMYIQQGLRRKLYEVLENHVLTSGFINFEDQEINRTLAARASVTGAFATLDMKDASDRVGWDLVRLLFPINWGEALRVCRSTHTLLPDGVTLQLRKFAPMGSACCFPIEALIFWAISSAAITKQTGEKHPSVFVYGDDIIVGTSHVPVVISGLEQVGLKVNLSKSFSRGSFRESCGAEYYNGLNVTPVKVRSTPGLVNTSRYTDADLCNEFIAKFGYTGSHAIVRIVEQYSGHPYPRTLLAQPGVIQAAYSASNDVLFRRRYNKSLQRYEHRIPTLAPIVKQYRKEAWCELMKSQLSLGVCNKETRNTLRRVNAKRLKPGEYAADHAVRTQWSWVWLGEPDPPMS